VLLTTNRQFEDANRAVRQRAGCLYQAAPDADVMDADRYASQEDPDRWRRLARVEQQAVLFRIVHLQRDPIRVAGAGRPGRGSGSRHGGRDAAGLERPGNGQRQFRSRRNRRVGEHDDLRRRQPFDVHVLHDEQGSCGRFRDCVPGRASTICHVRVRSNQTGGRRCPLIQ
jgi:hypothetical protein